MRGAWAFDIVIVLLLLGAPFMLASGWVRWWSAIRERRPDWHDWTSLVCLGIMSVTAIVGVGLWFYCESRYNGPQQRSTGEFWNFFVVWKVWARPVVRVLMAVALLGLAGTRRLIPFVFIGAVGGIAWWILPLWMQ